VPYITGLGPGDVIVVRTDGIESELIRFGAAMLDKDNLENHVAGFHHFDPTGVPWGIEGRPGGVGWVDLTSYLNNVFTITNKGQPKTDTQRTDLCRIMEQMLKVGYDWDAIGEDALIDLRIPDLWAEKWNGLAPAHVVCSSLYAWAYDKVHLEHPTSEDMRHIQPADWADFIIEDRFQ
jgi:hypothetical protein